MSTKSVMLLVDGFRDVEGEHRWNFTDSGKRFRSKFLEPGLVSYRDVKGGGIELLRKETIDAAINTAIGNPLTCDHVIVTAENRMNVEHGIVDAVDYDAGDGWYYASGDVDTEEARSRIRNNEKPSCGYVVTSFGPGGKYHGIQYDREITGIHFNHLAIVKKPRYENSNFRLNSIVSPTSNMTIFKFLKTLVTRANGADGKPTETTKVESRDVSGDTEVEVDGQMIRLNELAEVWRIQKSQVFEASGDDCIAIDGCDVKMNELVENFRKNGKKDTRENAAPVVEEKPKVEAEKKEEKKEEVRENAVPVVEAAKPVVEEKKTPEEKAAPFFKIRGARMNAAAAEEEAAQIAATKNSSGSLADRVKAGQARYGSAPMAGKN